MIVKLNQLLNMHQHSMKHQMNEFCLQQYFQCLCYCTLKANAENLQFLCLLYLDSFFLSLLCISISKPHTKTFQTHKGHEEQTPAPRLSPSTAGNVSQHHGEPVERQSWELSPTLLPRLPLAPASWSPSAAHRKPNPALVALPASCCSCLGT